MKLDVLMSCMHQTDHSLVERSYITSDAVVINQCDREGECRFDTEMGTVRWIDSAKRGLTKSRNMAIAVSDADVCLLCDDDEVFAPDYAGKILDAYEKLPEADVIIFKMIGRPSAFPDRIMELKLPAIMHVSSWQISFRRENLLRSGVRFDELMGAGTGNGAEEELKFLTDCRKAGLRIFYVPAEIASVAQTESTWFKGFDETFFYNRGATTRYILGWPMAMAYGLYYVLRKKDMYASNIAPAKAMMAILKGIRDNKISKEARKVI
jgi:glycosyltransferase involved in cell wall biosynthesis